MLKDDYETLLRRGMPECVLCVDGIVQYWHDGLPVACFDNYFSEPHGHPIVMGEQQARDLITMHALRWIKTLPGMRGGCQRWQDGWNVFLDDDYWAGQKNDPQIYKFTADDFLDAILAATAHLEPR